VTVVSKTRVVKCGATYVTLCAGALGDGEDKGDKKEMSEEDQAEAAELEEARREEEEKRTEKYRKMEEERETMRQGIRDKVDHAINCLLINSY